MAAAAPLRARRRGGGDDEAYPEVAGGLGKTTRRRRHRWTTRWIWRHPLGADKVTAARRISPSALQAASSMVWAVVQEERSASRPWKSGPVRRLPGRAWNECGAACRPLRPDARRRECGAPPAPTGETWLPYARERKGTRTSNFPNCSFLVASPSK
ncbi:hypothetical protein BS78_K275000 [Paspalum vaginatum]|uniref:Uncharacterized protein n=1 Tax=Paspalum vaginatum TaxID=158149 RepID=A0A9W7XDD5_9POAL|nr:hypothetical protein BS78_K275000 [Paspalum vaginatum]